MPLMHNAIEINSLSVILGGKFKALDDITLAVKAGSIMGFIGPSGAGKTTLIKSIVGRLKVRQGSVRVLGSAAGSPVLRRHVSYMSQELSVYTDLNVVDNLTYFGRMKCLDKNTLKAAVHQALELVDLTDKSTSYVSQLSGGQKQRVSLAVALLGNPELLIMDEPTVGLDPSLRENLWELFHKLSSQGTTLVISSHSMDEATRCDELVLISEGKIIANDTPKKVMSSTLTDNMEQAFLKLVRT